MRRAGRLVGPLTDPFKVEGKADISLIIAFVLINALVLLNAWFHDPRIGYDSASHLDYIKAFSKLHLVEAGESDEFFSPPLPYLFPSLLIAATGMDVYQAAKLTQFLNVLLSMGLIYYLIKICQLISSKRMVAFGSVVFLGILPVYYKTFAFVRAEPFVAFFATAALYYFLKVFVRRQYTWPNIVGAGLAAGCCILSRQWGLMLLPAVVVLAAMQWFQEKQYRRSIFKSLAASLVIAFLVSGWFYLGLKLKYGSFSAFNRQPEATFSIRNQPSSFYFGIAPEQLFSRPVRPNFPNQLIPIFYSEVWGDYWGYFAVFGKDSRKTDGSRMTGSWLSYFNIWEEMPSWMQTNYYSMGAYLGRVNLVSLFPSLLAVVATGTAVGEAFRRNTSRQAELSKSLWLLLLAVGFCGGGYLWFLILYPSPEKGDTIKATYMLHIFPVIAIFVGLFLERLEERGRLIPRFVIAGLLLVVLHNFLAMLTHFPVSPVPWTRINGREPSRLFLAERV